MPSLHAAWAVFTGWAVWVMSSRRELRVIAVLLPVITIVDVMATGNHYLLDGVAGVALAGLAAWSVTRAMAASDAR
jgi:membrane-associated phospholipid phosphatase